MSDRDGWWRRIKGICAIGTLDDDDDDDDIYHYTLVQYKRHEHVKDKLTKKN